MDVDRDRALHRRSGSIGNSGGALATREPSPMDVDEDRALSRRSDCIPLEAQLRPPEYLVVDRWAPPLDPPEKVTGEKMRWPVRADGAPESSCPLRYHKGQHRDFKTPNAEYVLMRGPCALGNPRPRCKEGICTIEGEDDERRKRKDAKLVAAQLPEGDLHGGQRNKIHPQPRE